MIAHAATVNESFTLPHDKFLQMLLVVTMAGE